MAYVTLYILGDIGRRVSRVPESFRGATARAVESPSESTGPSRGAAPGLAALDSEVPLRRYRQAGTPGGPGNRKPPKRRAGSIVTLKETKLGMW